MIVAEIARRAKEASVQLQALNEAQRVRVLEDIAFALKKNVSKILEANAKDLSESASLSPAMIDRLTLTEKSVEALAEMCLSVASQEQVVGQIVEEYTRPNGLLIQKQRIPIGVIGMIFESRPNVVVDGAALAIKSGNAIILKGGKEAHHTNRALFDLIHAVVPKDSVCLLETREEVDQLLRLNQYIDLMVPRGGPKLINHVRANATMPVVAHDKGLCHMYVHLDAINVEPIVINAKVQRPGVCNALESLLIHEKYPEADALITALLNSGVEVRGCQKTHLLNARTKMATPEDYDTEYLDKIISVKLVHDEDEAIEHIRKHSSHHTEAILTQDNLVAEKFLNSLDSSAIVINASTRFNDGGELGLGAELGISTSKLHAYGPMGAKEMTTTRFIVRGSGQIR